MIKDNLLEIKQRIATACTRAKCSSQEVALVAVTKGRSIEQIQEAIACGITDIGENRVQEARIKYGQLFPEGHRSLNAQLSTLNYHMVGHLQTNKVKEAVKIFDLIQSVDSLHLAREIDKEAEKINKVQDILLEVKTSPEETKSGLSAQEAIAAVKEISKLKNIKLKGLMTIAPIVNSPQEARPYFKELRALKENINHLLTADFQPLTILSMGMSDDFEVAIEEGSTMIRLGRAIFGDCDG